MKKIEDDLTSADAASAPLHGIEQMLRTQGNELMRLMMQTHLDHRAALEQRVEVRGADGIERNQVRHGTRQVETVFGEVEAGRNLYQAAGREGLAPADAAMELPPEKYSYEVRRMVAEQSAQSSFDEVVEAVRKYSGADVPKRQAEELTVYAARDFDGFYQDRLLAPEITDHLMVLSVDGKGIAMRHDGLRDATRKAAETTPRRLHTRLVKGEKPNRKRMAQVATVYTLARWQRTISDVLHGPHEKRTDRPRPTNKRVWASVEHSAQQVIDDAFTEGLRRDPERRRRWVVLVDGQLDQLRRVKRAARAAGIKITIVLDLIHVLEYLWSAAHAFHPGDSPEAKTAAEAWVKCRLLALLDGRSGGEIAKSLRLMIASHDLDARAKRAVERAAKYLVRHTRLLHYDRALADGLPIATGVIEGACRHLVQDRMGRTGARWSLEVAEAVLRLRALRASGDFDDYWQYHLAKEHERNHQSRYADGAVPKPLPPMTKRRPNLTLVK